MSEGDPLTLLSESAARVHALAREGLGLPQLDMLLLRSPWRGVAARFLEQPDGDYRIDELIAAVVSQFALHAELTPDHPAVAEETLLAWEAVARHLSQWVNELAENSLRGLEAGEESWRGWARAKKQQGGVSVEAPG